MNDTSSRIISANYNNKISNEEMMFLLEASEESNNKGKGIRQSIGRFGLKQVEKLKEKKDKTDIKDNTALKATTALYGAANQGIKTAVGVTTGTAALLLSAADHSKLEKYMAVCRELQKGSIIAANAGIIVAPNGLAPVMTFLITLYMGYGKDPLIKEALGSSLTICDKIKDWVNDVRKNPDEYKPEEKIEDLKHSIKSAASFAIDILQFWADLPSKKDNEEAYNRAIKNKRASVASAIKKIMSDKKAEAVIFKNNLKNKISYITDTDDDKFKMVQNHVWSSMSESTDTKIKILDAFESEKISLDDMKFLTELL